MKAPKNKKKMAKKASLVISSEKMDMIGFTDTNKSPKRIHKLLSSCCIKAVIILDKAIDNKNICNNCRRLHGN